MGEGGPEGGGPRQAVTGSGVWRQRLQARALAHRIPLSVMLEMTNGCNVHCRHCYIGDHAPKGELTLAEFEDILDQLAAAGTLFLTLSGGEPLVRDDFFQIAAQARERSFSLVLFSNGTLITPEVADRLAELYLQRVEISLLGGQAATHDRIMCVPGSFDRALRGAGLLIERGVHVQLKTTWMRENIEEAEQILDLVKEMGATFRGAYSVIHRRDGSAETADMRATAEQLRARAQRAFDRYGDQSVPPDPVPLTDEQKRDTPACGTGQTSCRIGAYGNVYPCAAIDIVLGSLRREKFAAIWGGSEELERIRAIRIADLTECRDCELLLSCSRCAGLALMETGSLLAPSPQACTVAHAFADFYREKRCELQ